MKNSSKSTGFFVFVILLGAIAGRFVGDILGNNIKVLSGFKEVYTIGLSSPVILDLKVAVITFGLKLNISIMSVIGIILAIILYRKR